MEKLFENGYDRELAEMKDLNMLNRKHREYYDDLCERFKYGPRSPISPDSNTTISSTPRSRSRSSHFHKRKSRDGNGRRSRRKRKSRSRSRRHRDEEADTPSSGKNCICLIMHQVNYVIIICQQQTKIKQMQ